MSSLIKALYSSISEWCVVIVLISCAFVVILEFVLDIDLIGRNREEQPVDKEADDESGIDSDIEVVDVSLITFFLLFS